MSDMQMILIILIVYFMLNSKSLCNGVKENFSEYAGAKTPSLEGCKECLNDDYWRKGMQLCEEESDAKVKAILGTFCNAKYKISSRNDGFPEYDPDKFICNSTIINQNTDELRKLVNEKCKNTSKNTSQNTQVNKETINLIQNENISLPELCKKLGM